VRGFSIEVDDVGPFGAVDVRGFREALVAAEDPSAPMPRRLVLSQPDAGLTEYLREWSEDVERCRRRMTIIGREGTVVATVTLSTFGPNVDPSLAVESLMPACDEIEALFLQSGIHPKAIVEAALARGSMSRSPSSPRGVDPAAL